MRQRDGRAVQRRIGGDLEVRVRADACELGALEQAVEERGDFGPALRAWAVVIFPAHDHASQRTLGRVVIDVDLWVLSLSPTKLHTSS